MSANSAARVELSQTFYGPDQTIDTADYAGIDLEGSMRTCLDVDPSNTAKLRSGKDRKAILMRNVSGVTLYKCMAVSPQAGYEGKRFDGLTEATAARCAGVINDQLCSAGVRTGDMCWVIVEGPNLCYTGNTEGDATSAGDFMYAKTAASSTANTVSGTTADDGGKIVPRDSSLTCSAAESTDGTLAKIIKNGIGRALSASTTAETNTEKLVDLNIEV